MDLEVNDIILERGSTVIGPISFKLESGTIMAICGKNGSGKTSTLTAINGYLPYKRGDILLSGSNIKKMNARERARHISFVQQEIPEPMGFNVRDIMEIAGFTRENSEEEILKSLQICGIENFINRDFSTLSGGEKRMVSIAAGIYQDSEFIMMDEPTSFLDIDKIQTVINIILKLKNMGKGILLVVHDINLALKVSDFVMLIKKGKMVAIGPTEETMNKENLEITYETIFDSYESPEGKRFYSLGES
jgi:iron complex transport system ATP-binding protein